MALRVTNLGIIGHAADKFTFKMAEVARGIIREYMERLTPVTIVSGGCHLGGVDIWAEEEAALAGIKTEIFRPKFHRWSPDGYKKRNLQIAANSDLVLVIVATDYIPGYRGMRFKGCYHCKGLHPPHVKSGACWTALHAPYAKWEFVPIVEG